MQGTIETGRAIATKLERLISEGKEPEAILLPSQMARDFRACNLGYWDGLPGSASLLHVAVEVEESATDWSIRVKDNRAE